MIKINKKSIIVFILFIIAGFVSIGFSYAIYRKGVEINVSTTTGRIMVDVELDNPGTYVSEEGNAYFYVNIKNYNSEGTLTDVRYSCDVEIKNQSASSGYYKYKYQSELKNIDGSDLTSSQINELGYTPDYSSDDDFELVKNVSKRYFNFSNKYKDKKTIMIEAVSYDNLVNKNKINNTVNFQINVKCYQKII